MCDFHRKIDFTSAESKGNPYLITLGTSTITSSSPGRYPSFTVDQSYTCNVHLNNTNNDKFMLNAVTQFTFTLKNTTDNFLPEISVDITRKILPYNESQEYKNLKTNEKKEITEFETSFNKSENLTFSSVNRVVLRRKKEDSFIGKFVFYQVLKMGTNHGTERDELEIEIEDDDYKPESVHPIVHRDTWTEVEKKLKSLFNMDLKYEINAKEKKNKTP